jgi:hypothetical protein
MRLRGGSSLEESSKAEEEPEWIEEEGMYKLGDFLFHTPVRRPLHTSFGTSTWILGRTCIANMDLDATCCRSPPHQTRITVNNTFLARAPAPLSRSKRTHLHSREKLILCGYLANQVEARRLTDEHFFAKEPGSMLWPLNWPKQVHTPQPT